MRCVIQRTTGSSVKIDGEVVGAIDKGLMVLIGVEEGDTEQDAAYVTKKLLGMRIFEDDAGKMNLSVQDVGGSILLVSQFTLCGDARKGNRPSFIAAAQPEEGNRLYEYTAQLLRQQGMQVQTGRFGADMKVSILNDGPVTILLSSRKEF